MHNRQQFFDRQASILAMAESLLLDSADGDLTLDELAGSLEIAKGTLYKHFASKDELYLHLLIDYEKQSQINDLMDDGAGAILARYLLMSLINPRKTMLYHWLEERLSANSTGCRALFDELYEIRRARMVHLLAVAKRYLEEIGSSMSEREYLPSLWSLGQGGASLLNSSYYQRFLGKREHIIVAWLHQALTLPKPTQSPTQNSQILLSMEMIKSTTNTNEHTNNPTSNKKNNDEFSPFGKLMPPAL